MPAAKAREARRVRRRVRRELALWRRAFAGAGWGTPPGPALLTLFSR